jgi:hypothetical protein
MSLERNCTHVEKGYKVSMQKQSMDERFNRHSLEFIKLLLEDQIQDQVSHSQTGFLKQFGRVLINDSTRFDVPNEMKERLPGFSGRASSKAGISIQYGFDIKDGTVTDLELCPAVTSDCKYVSGKKEAIRMGDLYIRDLGYYSTPLLSYVDEQQAFYLSRLNAKVNVYQKQGTVYSRISFSRLYSDMKKKNMKRVELEVYVGQKELMHTRLIVELMPEAVYARRTRKIEYYNKHNGHKTSQEQKDRMKFNLFITNVPAADLNPEQASLLYKIRWQIELRFKIWKSAFALDKLQKMKYDRYLCMVYAKLLFVFIYYEIIINIEGALHKTSGKKLSLIKCFNTIKVLSVELLQKLLWDAKGVVQIIGLLTEIFKKHHWLESKKNKVGINELFDIFTSYSI